MDRPAERRTKFKVRARDKALHLGETTAIMAVVNLTPDSFFSESRAEEPAGAIDRALELASDGADILDLGAESTRPGANKLSEDDEWARLEPVLNGLRRRTKLPISVDTRKAGVAQKALELGADIINDISGLRDSEAMGEVVASHGAAIVLMHMQGDPETMQDSPRYENLMQEITDALLSSIRAARSSGIGADQILVDPGIGFGKTLEHNLILLNRLGELTGLEKPVLVGTSRKSFIEHLMGLPVDARLHPTSASIAVAISHGAHVVRVHDVLEMKQVATLTDAILAEGRTPPVKRDV